MCQNRMSNFYGETLYTSIVLYVLFFLRHTLKQIVNIFRYLATFHEIFSNHKMILLH